MRHIYLYKYIYIYIYIYLYIYVCVHIHIYMCTYIHTCVHQQTIHFVNTTNRFVYEPFYRDFGPLNLSQLYRYCHYMHEKLKSKPGMKICHWSPNDGSHAANSVRLYRVYMGLFHICIGFFYMYISLFNRKSVSVRLCRVYMGLSHICIGLFCIYIGLFHRKTLSVRIWVSFIFA